MNLEDFIETPSQNYSDDELQAGVSELLNVLNENPYQVILIIKNCICPSSYILRDLAKKMELQHCVDKLSILFNKHLNELVDLCVWSWHDLQRLIDSQPSYLEKIMKSVGANDDFLQRLQGDASNSQEIISYIKDLSSDCELPEQFAELFQYSIIPRL